MAEAPLSAEEIAHRGFPSSFRGFDPAEVRAYLVRVATELKAAAARERDLQQKLADAERRAANPVIDQAMLTRALGDETSRVLASAQQAAHELKTRAEESVAGILREAHEQAQRIRAAAEVVLADRTEEADAAAGEIRAAAQAEAHAVIEQARREAEEARNDVADQSRQLVQEAQAARARVLGDLTRRRRIAHTQVEQLRAGRERLLDAYRVVRRTLDEVADELERVEPEAREAASAAARRVEAALADAPAPAEGQGEGRGQEEGGGDATGSTQPDPGERAVPVELAESSASPAGPGSTVVPVPVPPTEPGPGPGIEPAAPARRSPSRVAAPVVAREEHAEERKLSSLRILRRPKPESVPELEVLEPPSAVEGVRVIGLAADREGTPPLAPPAPPPARPTPSLTPGISWAPSPAVIDGPGPDPAPEFSGASPVVGAAPAAPAAPVSTVDDLFARLRAAAPPAAPSAAITRLVPAEVEPGPGPQPGELTPAPALDAKEPDREGALQRREESTEAIQAALVRKLKRALQDEHNDVLDRLRSCREVPTTIEAFLPSRDDQAARYGAAAGELLQEAVLCGTRFVSSGEPDPGAADVADVVAELVDALVGPLRRGMERIVGGGPGDSSVLVDSVGAAYRDCRSQRLDLLAGDATIAAFSRGTVSAAAGAALVWVVDSGDRACPDCADNALAGPTPSGQAYPTGQAHPPAHAGCRCLLVPDAP